MPNKNKSNKKAKKSATNNKWINTGLARPVHDERRDGPGGENAK